MFEFQEDSTLSYQLGYITGTSITVSGISWITGKILSIVGNTLENTCSGGFRETGLQYYGKKGARGLKTVGDILALPVDAVFVGSCIGVRMCVNSLVKKNISTPEPPVDIQEEMEQDSMIIPPLSDMRLLFHGFIRNMPSNLRSLFFGSGSQSYEDIYQRYLLLDFEGRCDVEDILQKNAEKINSIKTISIIFDAYRAGAKNPQLKCSLTTEEAENKNKDRDSDDEFNDPNLRVDIEHSPENIRKALEQGTMNQSQADFLSFAQQKSPGK